MNEKTCNHCGAENKEQAKFCSQCGYELKVSEQIVTEKKEDYKVVKNNKNAIWGAIIGIIFFALAYLAVHHFILKSPSIDKALSATANEVNKTCPAMVDAITRLDNAIALPNNTFQYNYTLITLDKNEIHPDSVKKYLEPGIINGVKTMPELKFFRDKKTTMVYHYRDKNGQFVYMFSVTPDMYK